MHDLLNKGDGIGVAVHITEHKGFEQLVLQIIGFERDGVIGRFECDLRLALIDFNSSFKRECGHVVRIEFEHLLDAVGSSLEVAYQVVAFSNTVVEIDTRGVGLGSE